MPRSKKSAKVSAPPTKSPEAPSPARREEPSRGSSTPSAPFEQAFDVWTRFAKETGETVSEYLRRFGEEQQKNYESWLTSVADSTRPSNRGRDVHQLQGRLEEWNHRAEEIGNRVRDAFQAALEPQTDLFETWVRPFLPKDASTEERAREATQLVQKLWGGLSTTVARRLYDAMQPGHGVEDLVKAQEESLKEFTESFQKLTQVYFTSPAFVTMFGKTLDASMDLQKAWKDQDDVFSKLTGFPTRREITELNQAVRDLSQKVSRLSK